MSQKLSNKLETEQSFATSSARESWSAEADADKLMDDLFSDIERILDGGSKLPTEPAQPEYVSLQPVVIPSISMPKVLREYGQLIPQPKVKEIQKQDRKVDGNESQNKVKKIIISEHLDIIIFAIACILTLGVLWLLASQGRIKLPFFSTFLQEATLQENQLSESDAQFIAYMQRSLEVIERKTQTSKSEPKESTAKSSTSLPPLPNASKSVSPNSQLPAVVERIYIPIYPPNQPSADVVKPPTVPTVPAVPLAPVASLSPSPSPSPSPQASPSPETENKTDVSTAILTTPAVNHVLVGLVESEGGTRSAALFNIDGVTYRIELGEGIGSSDWTLVSVAHQKAIIRRNGEVRSIYVGQKL